ncbi:hypothetical protein F4821DRAFT_279506 [Hypoxylon rubiginosum]|uniref:Uncharacterized protein n=1 Tax=Hypoxylon rubiginosum TaxID=110542 RepID=A0ACC0DIV2_9PEZI|nr:hypothetical protein F4821DRAFT_279506 [Hypoxylon rubiginosum]
MHLTQGCWTEDIVGRNMATFTALNGGEPKGADRPSSSPTSIRAASEERPARQITTQEPRVGESSASQREHWSGPSPDRPSYQPISYPDIEGSHKRKRSISDEPHREGPIARDREQQPQAESRDPYSATTTPRERDYRPYGDEGREHHESWYSQQGHQDSRSAYDQQSSASVNPSPTDDHAGSPLRRSVTHADSQQDYSATSPDGDDALMYGSSSYSAERKGDTMIQSDPKKRKRNFSNRTKTGKKKCDETKPQCTNCVRGGFVCHGYPNQRGYPKMENKPAAVPLESKDPSYVPPGAYGMPQQSNYPIPPPPPPPPPKRDQSAQPYRGQSLRIEPVQGRPILVEDNRPPAPATLPTPTPSATSPENKLSSISYNAPTNVFPTPISATSTNMQLPTPLSSIDRHKDYQRVPPLHDLTRTEHETSHPNSLPQINILPPTRSSSPPTQSQPALPPPPPPPPPPQIPATPTTATDSQEAARQALTHSAFAQDRERERERTQKEEMLSGNQYYPFDEELMLERQRCSVACFRFNNSTNPNVGVSAAERSRLFREILNPTEPIAIEPQLVSSFTPAGSVGQGVVVEAPFNCDYGYNIVIGNNVFIGRNCTVIDPTEVIIGNNCYIGPNVNLFGGTLYTDPRKRKGSRSPHFGAPIHIDEDVWIGGGAIILLGIKIGKGATVAAGAVVTKDVPPFTVVAGNPARVTRGAIG